MFCDTLKLPVETLENPFIVPVNIEIIESFMHMVGYQGVVDKVSAFFMKNLAQPWQTMFKVFNHCLTTRTSRHDQTKINILQLFHAMINRTNVDYDALLWWDFMNNVFQKKDVIQYPRFTKLIIADLMKKYPSISPRLEEDYHSIKDDIPLVSVYTMRNVQVRGMLILDAFLTEEIRATDDFKEYETVFDTSSPRKSLKVTIRQKKQSITLIPPPSDDREMDEIAKATLLKEEIEKMVEGEEDDESYTSKFADSMLNEDVDDLCTRIEPGSHKENLEVVVVDDDVNDKQKQDESKDDNVEKTDDVAEEKDNDDQTEHTLHLVPLELGCYRDGIRAIVLKLRYLRNRKIREVLDHCNNVVPELTFTKTNEMIKEEMPRLVDLAVQKDREITSTSVPELISKEFATHGPKMIE
ncbi:hypothetical protein Tco_0478195 [Tanacetum coccineum]